MFVQAIIAIICSAAALTFLFLFWCLAGFSRELSRRRDCFAWLLYIEGPSCSPAKERRSGSILDISAGKTAA